MITQPRVPSTAAAPAGEWQRGIAWIVRAHAEQHGLVRATGGAHGTDPVRATVPRRSLGLTPANPIVDVGQRGRIRCHRRHAKIQCRHDHTMLRQRFVARVAVQTIPPDPRPAMQFDHDRERSAAARLEETRQQRFVAVPEIFHVCDVNVIGCLCAWLPCEPPFPGGP